MHSRHLCERGIYDGGPNDPRTLVYRYQQRLRADLLAKAADEANRTARWPACLLATRAAVRASVESFQADLPVERCPATVVPYHRVIERRRRRSKLGVIGLQGRVLDLVAGTSCSPGRSRSSPPTCTRRRPRCGRPCASCAPSAGSPRRPNRTGNSRCAWSGDTARGRSPPRASAAAQPAAGGRGSTPAHLGRHPESRSVAPVLVRFVYLRAAGGVPWASSP
jgi:hypothetical protein